MWTNKSSDSFSQLGLIFLSLVPKRTHFIKEFDLYPKSIADIEWYPLEREHMNNILKKSLCCIMENGKEHKWAGEDQFLDQWKNPNDKEF